MRLRNSDRDSSEMLTRSWHGSWEAREVENFQSTCQRVFDDHREILKTKAILGSPIFGDLYYIY